MNGTLTFLKNKALNSGGAYFLNDIEPIKLDNLKEIFDLNTAIVYGDNVGTYASKIVQVTQEQYYNQLIRANPNYSADRRRSL